MGEFSFSRFVVIVEDVAGSGATGWGSGFFLARGGILELAYRLRGAIGVAGVLDSTDEGGEGVGGGLNLYHHLRIGSDVGEASAGEGEDE